ncbi:MAG: bifunctional UDP-N-acetylglucosamine diphosphorylase/glucosamine-1-phosphate N-acetyltransferase GlmU [Sulfurihydrogenibium azorense]|uniref:bifunctional UDP-N-acetylglucosamine diphosphorylase/glucosamine-1-phosphate N-acetyltransferase GlmU n=1 Tax=Sulfurihydrogenibium azorense TaxID=309806 RepID=UPI00391C93E6
MIDFPLIAVVLAAGKGTRFKSEKPKVVHQILGKPMLWYTLFGVRWIKPQKTVIVVGHKKDEVINAVNCDGCEFVYQEEQLGTGHAVYTAKEYFKDFDGYVLIINGDTPLVRGETLHNAGEYLKALIRYEGADLTNYRGYRNKSIAGVVLTARVPNPYGYGRIIKDKDHRVIKIVEEKDANNQEKQINEVNSGIYFFYAPYLIQALEKLENKNAQEEYYLTDVIEILRQEEKYVYALEIPDYTEILGVNDRLQLAGVENILKERYITFWALNGTTFHNPQSVWIEFDVDLSRDVEIHQNVVLQGKTFIDEGTVIEPNCIIRNSKIGKNVKILANSYIEDSEIQDNAVIGPFARIRGGSVIKEEAVIGNFVEVKNSVIGRKTNARHLSYLGDAEIGEEVNIGAGTITCNFDGFKKHKTVIKDRAFIGSDTMLVAPVVIGEEAITGSGSVITKDVPDKALAIERNQQKIIENYAEKRKKKYEKS